MKLLMGLLIACCAGMVQAGDSILYIGDSHSAGEFGRSLDKLLRAIPDASAASYGSCGSIARWWYTGQKTPCGYRERLLDGTSLQVTSHATPKFLDLVSAQKPNFIVVELGANYVNEPSDDVAIRDMSKLARDVHMSGASCLWVSAPDSRKYRTERERVYRLVVKAVSDYCTVIDSREYTHYPETGGDGVHFDFPAGMPEARKWASAVADKVKDMLVK